MKLRSGVVSMEKQKEWENSTGRSRDNGWRISLGSNRCCFQTHWGRGLYTAGRRELPSRKGPFPSIFRAPPAHNWPQPGPDFLTNKNICHSSSRTILKLVITVNTLTKGANHTLEKEQGVKSRGCPIFTGRFLVMLHPSSEGCFITSPLPWLQLDTN